MKFFKISFRKAVKFFQSALIFTLMLACTPGDAGAQGKTQESKNYTDTLKQVFTFIENNYVDETEAKKLYEGAMQGMLAALDDPYSQFLAESDMAELNQNVIQGNYGGVGLYISKIENRPDGLPPYVEIASPIEDTPGWRAGLQGGDLILKVNDISTHTLTMDKVLAILKGEAGKDVNLLIRRGENLEFPVVLTRAIIEVPSVKSEMIGSDIGYVRLISFSNHTADRTKEAIEGFKAKGYKALIVDLRNNYGGLLKSAVDVSNLFLAGGEVVAVKSRIARQNITYNAGKEAVVDANIPIVVLINRASASASEIVAGALKDRRRAYLVGEKSYGKGSVQQVYPLENSGFKLTTARYYTPSDVNIDKIGIPPDKEVLFIKYSDEDTESYRKLVLSNAIPAFIRGNPKADKETIDGFIAQTSTEYHLDVNLLRRLVRDEQRRTDMPLVYDLEFDVQLIEAVDILRSGDYPRLIANTKTLKALQDEVEIAATNEKLKEK